MEGVLFVTVHVIRRFHFYFLYTSTANWVIGYEPSYGDALAADALIETLDGWNQHTYTILCWALYSVSLAFSSPFNQSCRTVASRSPT